MANAALVPRVNPFRVSRYPSVPIIVEGGTVQSLADTLERVGFCGTLTGKHGNGKTTLLEQLSSEVGRRGVPTELRYLPTRILQRIRVLAKLALRSDSTRVLFLDRGEALSFVERVLLRIARYRWRGLVMTTHSKTPLPVLCHMKTTPEILHRVAVQLATSAGRVPPERALCNRLFVHRRGNIREALLDLYDLYGA